MSTLAIILIVLVVLSLFGYALKGLKDLFGIIGGFLKGIFITLIKILKSPFKAGAIIKASALEGKIKRAEKKLAKKVTKEDKKARLNAALRNPSYLNAEKVRPTVAKLDLLKSKRK